MRRGAILMVPMRVFKERGIVLFEDAHRGNILAALGINRLAIQFCDRWWEDVKTDCVCFRFQTGERDSKMPEWPELSIPCHIHYDHDGFFGGDSGWKAAMLNAYFPAETHEPEKAAVPLRRFVSLEG